MPPPDRLSDNVLGVVLAGGQGRRLGGDKALRLLAGRPLITHVIARLRPQLDEGWLSVSCGGDEPDLAKLGLPLIRDTLPGLPGPLAGILAAMLELRRRAKADGWVLSVPTDTPFLPPDLLTRCQQRLGESGAEILLAESAGGLCQVCGLWSSRLAGDLAQSLEAGQNKVLGWAARHRVEQVMFPLQPLGDAEVDPFFNVNTPQDLQLVEKLFSDRSP